MTDWLTVLVFLQRINSANRTQCFVKLPHHSSVPPKLRDTPIYHIFRECRLMYMCSAGGCAGRKSYYLPVKCVALT